MNVLRKNVPLEKDNKQGNLLEPFKSSCSVGKDWASLMPPAANMGGGPTLQKVPRVRFHHNKVCKKVVKQTTSV